tara:strand:- start:317 stop:478 length:162 start_codon:yes stop_codon:yes gene_type:complete
VEERFKTTYASEELLQHLERYPEDILDIRRLQKNFKVDPEAVAHILETMTSRH